MNYCNVIIFTERQQHTQERVVGLWFCIRPPDRRTPELDANGLTRHLDMTD